jgi:hypothetical protein
MKNKRLGIFPLLASWNELEGTPMEAPCDCSHYKNYLLVIYGKQITTENMNESTTQQRNTHKWAPRLNKQKLRGLSLQARTIPTERPPLVGEVSANLFSPSTLVSPDNLHSTNCSTSTLIYHLGLVQ